MDPGVDSVEGITGKLMGMWIWKVAGKEAGGIINRIILRAGIELMS